MVLKLYLSRTSGNMEIKKQQELLLRVLNGKKIEYEEIDISDPALDGPRNFMREHGRTKEGQKFPLPPQIFNEDEYCGDFDAFHEANESDTLYEFFKLDTENQNQNGES